jgi:hypothetical protein
MSNSIKVVARFRPQNRNEIELGGQPIVKFETEDTCSLDVGAFRYRIEKEVCILIIAKVERGVWILYIRSRV